MFFRTCLGALVAVAATAAWAGPYDGRYRPDHPSASDWDCTNIGEDGGAIAIAANTFFAVGSRCSLRNATPVGSMDATLYDAICRADGAPWERRIMIMRTDAGITVIQKGGVISPLRRCE
ncbi:hypothetical protein [Sulfitobacter sp. S190]|uniref:hypothetical protein n=1 Tax=Sulfitobacter sp. S190 TaxID=2867022 RepID=UPI0021A370B0|nr:hypothetical protein [Sulfitobacter sp. S190]UWR22403.1 hypothetical protein K3756_17360 [Sulfitobacter sp. S190]